MSSPGIAAVLFGVGLDQLKENVLGFENAGVVSEQAEQQAHEQLFEIMPGVVRILHAS